ncbi:maleylpyruvate isomerase family mycothiol-dependent enzyme [Segeticoccus rhizosphaerae]|uniref:maleylpyruvate isomerase family mycothiol-dependent enzyme n=1 Tax=Segeticoccus rhizosphaerae TaxID=1104777 RepID=UPI0010BFD722|nr:MULTISPECIES: maleylpyruvate isomerase family mycothiol-dependent enzyme [Intrasporangiaceae]
MTSIRDLHRQALDDATTVIDALDSSDWGRDSRCAGWSVRKLVEHMTGQNFGFAAALADGDAPQDAYAPRTVDQWAQSVDTLRQAATSPADRIRLVEVRPETRHTGEAVLGFQTLDTVVHTWDITGPPHRPAPALVDLVARQAQLVPTQRPVDAPFAPVVDGDDSDPWLHALHLLGRVT